MSNYNETESKKPGAGDITPDTKVGDLLKNFPQLEEKLYELAPAFKKLKNPFLRKTIGRVATIRQAAEVGDLSLGMMINTLRSAAGLSELTDMEDENGEKPLKLPDWVSMAKEVREFDARPIIEAGEHPLNMVREEVARLNTGEVLKLITPFVPAPLIQIVRGEGYKAWSKIENHELAYTYFKKED